MCGIAGFEIVDEADALEKSSALLSALKARGPDASWFAIRGSFGLVETRLAVIDLSDEVVYPMANEAGDMHLVFNGEIYDHEVLREELENLGHRFRTRCDAEVVVHGYEQWGTRVFPRLNGMFALAIVDQRSGETVLARDRLGIKPLVRTTGPRFAFASDAIALVEAGLSVGEVDLAALEEFAVLHYLPPPATGISDVLQVAPGTAVRRRVDGTEEEIVWGPTPFAEPERGDPVTIDEAEQALLTAVRRQLAADVAVGIFLSGGLDSTLVLSAAVALGARPDAFSLGFAGHGDYDETDAASRVAKQFDVRHHVVQLESTFPEAVAAIGQAYDMPFADASAVATLELARLARPHVKVVLSGTGGDDLFAGYYRHRAHLLRPLFARVPRTLSRRVQNGSVAQGSGRRTRVELALSYLSRLARASGHSDAEQYLELLASLTSPLGSAALRFPVDPPVSVRATARRRGFVEPLAPTTLRAIQRFELRTYLPGDLLCKEDRATMALGLEARVPLLDEAMVELAEGTPERRTMSIWRGKIILRELAERFGAPLTHVKRGFAVPLGAYFMGRWRADAHEWFSSLESDLVDGVAASALLRLERPPATDVWMLASLAAWEQRVREARSTRRTYASDELAAFDAGVRARP